ncbi:MAG: thiol:disulfide interchange protein DsbA/DsbL [Pseudomonadota bacterium]
MKKVVIGIVLTFLVPLQVFGQVKLWQEGVHYNVIADERTAKPEVKEFFSFWCPVCFRTQPLVAEIKKQLPEGTSFNKVHVNFLSATSPAIQEMATKSMMIGKQLGEEEKLIDAIFNYIHVQGQARNISKIEDFRNLFVVNGVSAEDFDKHAKSFAVNSLLNRNKKQLNEKRQHLTGVPNFIVNGKYQVVQGGTRTVDESISLILWLLKQD